MKYILLFIWLSCSLHSRHYMYPVASVRNGTYILFIKQTSPHDIELIIKNSRTDKLKHGLWSLFKPAGLQVLPGERGFSFIDNGRLRIKYFNKRSPKTIDFDRYFYTIHSVVWINQEEFCCSAKEPNGYYALFHCTLDGKTQPLISACSFHAMYPQKIDDTLFYIKETDDKKYSIVKASYSNAKHIKEVIVSNFDTNPIAFLYMRSAEEGFVVQYSRDITKDNFLCTFHYYHIVKQEDIWQQKRLFSFSVPSYLLMSTSELRLYESLLPLIPRVVDDIVYFVDSFHNNGCCLELFEYNIRSLEIKKYNNTKHQSHAYKHLFVPLITRSVIILGGEIS